MLAQGDNLTCCILCYQFEFSIIMTSNDTILEFSVSKEFVCVRLPFLSFGFKNVSFFPNMTGNNQICPHIAPITTSNGTTNERDRDGDVVRVPPARCLVRDARNGARHVPPQPPRAHLHGASRTPGHHDAAGPHAPPPTTLAQRPR